MVMADADFVAEKDLWAKALLVSRFRLGVQGYQFAKLMLAGVDEKLFVATGRFVCATPVKKLATTTRYVEKHVEAVQMRLADKGLIRFVGGRWQFQASYLDSCPVIELDAAR
jgi:hypothetical protein